MAERNPRLRSRPESSSSSSSCGSHTRGNIPPIRASEWKLCHLESIGIFYEENALPLTEFMSRLKGKRVIEKYNLTELPPLSRKLILKDEEIWTFSLDLSDDEMIDAVTVFEKIDVVENAMENFQNKQNELRSEMAKELEDDRGQILFHNWRFSLLEFWKYCRILLSRFDRPFQREGKFTNLFMAFSKIFFLQPEPGGSYSEVLPVKSVLIHSIPDVRFITYRKDVDGRKRQKIVIVTEVKKYDAFSGSSAAENFSFKNLSSKVLGQHGVQLLMERTDSFFFPGVVGIICVGTKIIFTYLEMSRTHFEKIQLKGDIDKKSYISYTRPFDFMDALDRKDLLEPFTWFGYVQSGAYSIYT